ncbi:hypothetical protein OJAV_G00233030 [Oryzias javanicus]|uniref:Uncharacterized protein n=1 Tax=Oryzias javanicus TaxID=123683 RepID=A0A3S2PA16_ORYJA|nr:hypothetical protein OJAV_G00233030 [Oryzias javanicus]
MKLVGFGTSNKDSHSHVCHAQQPTRRRRHADAYGYTPRFHRTGEVMFVLLRKIRRTSETAATVLQKADFCTDSEIRSLTREDLHELFPGAENLKLRKTIFRIIHKQKPLNLLLRELKCLISHNSLNAVPSKNGVLTDYLHVLRNLQTQLNHVQSFLEAHIGLLEDISKTHVDQEAERGDLPETSSSTACTQPHLHASQADVQPAQLTYQMIVSGRTWDAHLQLMAKVQTHLQDHVQLISCSQNGQIVFVFCHVGSHAGAEIDISDDVPVILVQMHHLLPHGVLSRLRNYFHFLLTQNGGNMTTLLEKIENYGAQAAFKLRGAGFQTDSEIQTLTPEKLEELFPGQENLNLRKDILKIIQNQEERKGVIVMTSICHFVSSLLKRIQGFVIWSLRRIDRILGGFPSRFFAPVFRTIDQTLYGYPSKTLGFVSSIVIDPLLMIPGIFIWILLPNDNTFYGLRKVTLVIWIVCFIVFRLTKRTSGAVMYKRRVYGETFGAHLQLLDQIQTSGLNLIEGNDKESCITIVFCPLTSRIGTDAEAAMRVVPGNDPVILVLMHYFQEPKHIPSSQVLPSYSYPNAPPTGAGSVSTRLRNHFHFLTTQNDKGRPSSSQSVWDWIFGSPKKPAGIVKYKMFVCGPTFGAHLQFLDQIQTSGLKLIEGNDEESSIIIVFCPVATQPRTDAEAAVRFVPGDDPVILVLMHYNQEPKDISSSRVLPSYPNVVLELNVFYHDRKKGLLRNHFHFLIWKREADSVIQIPTPEDPNEPFSGLETLKLRQNI